ncbi:hypothetical protein [Paenibacillus alvei]|uniref:hypothetical protein n=1 Tax=Paenibacillus alvei TaxID=44250 RepID=UPI0018CD88EC|nr:hypothetical protein [Paenibacillus alvei]MBG9734956.1 hypothetical protein [Paenibacillus alvei]MBG9744831.1 hypothetical protein [Paenibacillus alvei]MCY9578722.1 hypothetical protein [Paenibacillus alvei]MCY9583780.1 hypothetical protein [Paenibacillus alvei]
MSKTHDLYSRYRAEPIQEAQKYISSDDSRQKGELKRYLKSLKYKDLLTIQSNRRLWEQLLLDPDPLFRRQLCSQSYKITQKQIAQNISGSTKTGFALINETLKPENFYTFVLAVMFNVPWQIIIEKKPVEYSFNQYTEYFLDGSAKRISVEALYKEKTRVSRNIVGYLITDAQRLIEQAGHLTTGRWVTTYPELDYFEFHCLSEPVIDNAKKKEILNAFPFATHFVTTYTPFRSERSLWVMGPKPGKLQDYEQILMELQFRDLTIVREI